MAKLVGVDGPTLYLNLLKPKIKVGNEFVTQGRNKDQVCTPEDPGRREASFLLSDPSSCYL